MLLRIQAAILWVQWVLFGRCSVILVDFDGSINLRLVHSFRGHLFAKRVGLGIRLVRLLENGRVQNGRYVDRWEPLYPADSVLIDAGISPNNVPTSKRGDVNE